MIDRIDMAWLTAHPLPSVDDAKDKNERGRVLVAGGSEFVPGALRLTGEAALRAGAGKLQLATVRAAAMGLGVLVPEAAMIALPGDAQGEIGRDAAPLLAERLDRCDALVLGPGMGQGGATPDLVAGILGAPQDGCTVVLDAAALTASRDLVDIVRRWGGRIILTPHHGEMAALADVHIGEVEADPRAIAEAIAQRYGAVVLLKARVSILARPDGPSLLHDGGCPGLGTGGSGDVLAGIIGGLAARGAAPHIAAGWGAWVHGQAGEALAGSLGPVGFLARELLPLIPRVIADGPG